MNLRDLVGRMAIRTDKVREVMPWEMERAFRLDFMVPVPIFDREKYMDEPVRILAVEGTQVVIEEDGKRKLLERRYIDEHWTDYERLLHPEEEEKPYNILVDAEDSVGCSKGVYELDCCMVDATVADMIIQYAIFDDVIYG